MAEGQEIAVTREGDENTLDYYVQRRNKKKRNYVFRYKKARSCDHPTLELIARGGTTYYCPDCNYSFDILGANIWPLHFQPIMGAFKILWFAKRFGGDALGEVLRRPIGQSDGSPHKPVLPEGMSFMDVVQQLDEVDVNTEDGGASELKQLLQRLWEQPSTPALGEGENSNGTDASNDSP